MSVMTCRNLSKSYGHVLALDDISLCIEQGGKALSQHAVVCAEYSRHNSGHGDTCI